MPKTLPLNRWATRRPIGLFIAADSTAAVQLTLKAHYIVHNRTHTHTFLQWVQALVNGENKKYYGGTQYTKELDFSWPVFFGWEVAPTAPPLRWLIDVFIALLQLCTVLDVHTCVSSSWQVNRSLSADYCRQITTGDSPWHHYHHQFYCHHWRHHRRRQHLISTIIHLLRICTYSSSLSITSISIFIGFVCVLWCNSEHMWNTIISCSSSVKIVVILSPPSTVNLLYTSSCRILEKCIITLYPYVLMMQRESTKKTFFTWQTAFVILILKVKMVLSFYCFPLLCI